MKIGILIGRFQVPEPHEGHRYLINRILERCDELVILVGSSNRARSVTNPYTFLERVRAITSSFSHEKALRIHFMPLNDYLYSDSQWMADVANTIKYSVGTVSRGQDANVTMFGHFKDGNDYLKWFPQFKYEEIESDIEISGTQMREVYKHMLPDSVQEDMTYFAKELEKFASYPYFDSLNINCGDTVLECIGHIALILRGSNPGKGSWALPGGHKNTNETFLDCAIRELYEETQVKVPEKVLRGSIVSTKLFDSPKRSNGIPKSTLAVHIKIEPNHDGSLPKLKAADDAVLVRWIPIENAINNYRLHDDHKDIISTMTGVMPVIAYLNQSITHGT